ncbi:MAG: 30S ribosomal protein S7 [Alphaproteobacteria bacterium]|nr:30S ribosomal protein S7 [Alphaproteobacteria bacterium]
MSRRRRAEVREILPDAKFGDKDISKFINNLMMQGKKSIAESIVYGALDIVAAKTKREHTELFHESVDKIKPHIEVRSRRVGGATYQVPVEVSQKRASALAFRWLIHASRKRGEKTMRDRLANEILDSLNDRGSAVKKRDDTHKMAEANRAFAHYRW